MRWKESYTSLLFILPAVVYIAFFSIVPTVQAVYGSFQSRLGALTLANFQSLFFLGAGDAVVNTLVISFGALALQFVLAFIFASIMKTQFRGNRPFTVLTIIPWGIATVVAAFSFANIFNPFDPLGGYSNSFLHLLGVSPVNWYSSYALEVFVLVVSDSWKNTPIVALILLAGMTGISEEIYQAAAVDGAGRVRRFLFITLPNLRNFIIIALVIRGISEFNIFALPLVLVGTNPPLLTTLTYSLYTSNIPGEAYAASTNLLAFILAFALVALRLRRSG